MNDKTFYKKLGVSPRASDKELKNAFHREIKKHHPDCTNNNPNSKQEFIELTKKYKEITERRKNKEFKGFSIIKDVIFSGAAHFEREEPIVTDEKESVKKPGDDIFCNITITEPESMIGCKKFIHIQRKVRCKCNTGDYIDSQCPKCKGKGFYTKMINVSIIIPPNVQDEQILKITGKGHNGDIGTPNGNLIIHVNVVPDERFVIRDHDIYYKQVISFPEAITGVKKTIPTIYGDECTVNLPPGIMSRSVVSLHNYGLPYSDGSKGDEKVVVIIEIPKIELNDENKQLLKDIEEKFYSKK